MKDFWDDIKTWFSKQPLWLQHTTQRLIKNNAIIEEKIEELLLLCKKEAGIDIDIELDPIPVEIPKGGSPSKASGTSMRLLSIIDLKGINALAPRNPLQFGDVALAVIYGANGSGKSGYIRALKHASGARNPGPLHGNVFDRMISEQSCTFEIDFGSQIKKITWSPSDGVIDELRSIAMYDAACGYVYVNEENEVTYEPGILSLFSILTEVCGKVSQMLKEEIERTESRQPLLPRELELTEMGVWYNQLSYSTDIAEVDEKCGWTEEYELELTELKKRLSIATPDERIKTLKESNDNLMTLMSQLKTFRNRLSDKNRTTYLSAKADLRLKKRAAEEDAKKVFSDAPLKGVGSEIWKLLWEQARKYSEEIAYRGIPFPNVTDDARCVLCHQPLDEKSERRFQSFEQFVKGGLQKDVCAAEEHLSVLSDALEEIPVEDNLKLLLSSAGITEDAERKGAISYCLSLHNRKESLLKAEGLSSVGTLPLEDILISFQKRSVDREQEILKLEEDAKSENREAIEKKAKELEAQRWISQQRTAIEDEIKRLRDLYKLEEARKLTNTQQLSVKKSALADELITSAYIQRFNNELKKLGASCVHVELVKSRTEHGRVYHQIRLKDCFTEVPAAEVLSEGEFRIVSLAAFIADMEAEDSGAPFIFDDPISSLDQDFEEASVARVVELCRKRQVIVFTHRLSMLSLLEDAAKKEGIEPHIICLRCQPWGIGEPDEAPLFAKKPDKVLNTLLKERLPRANKVLQESGVSEYEVIAKSICSDVRILLERLIEKDLLANIICRFRRSVQTDKKIDKLARIKAEDCKMFDHLMTKYSRYEHSQPDELAVSLPLPDEIKPDLENLKTWLEEFKKR